MAHMLITVCEREIAVEEFDTYEQAHAKMLEELKHEFDKDEDIEESWEEILATNGDEASYDVFGYNKFSAWSNLDDDCLCDWLIVPIHHA